MKSAADTLVPAAVLLGAAAPAGAKTHAGPQAVDANGTGAWAAPDNAPLGRPFGRTCLRSAGSITQLGMGNIHTIPLERGGDQEAGRRTNRRQEQDARKAGHRFNRQRPARKNLKALLLIPLLALATNGLQAGRPLITDDAGTVAPGNFEFEAGATWHRDSDQHDYEFPLGVTVGLLPTLEAGIGFGSQIQERQEVVGSSTTSGIGDLALGAKWNPLPEDNYWASHAVAFTVKFPTASDDKGLGTGETDFDLTYIASKSLSSTWSAHLNAGYTWTGDPDGAPEDDLFHVGVALGWRAAPPLELVAEVFANSPEGLNDDATVECRCGLRWSPCDALILDAALGTRLRGEAPDLTATLGLTWTLSRSNQP